MDWSDFKALEKTKSGKAGIIIACISVVWFFAKVIHAAETGSGIFGAIIGFGVWIGISWVLFCKDAAKLADPEKMWAKWTACADSKPQIQRMKRAADGDIAVKKFDPDQKMMVVVGSSGNKPYVVTLQKCTCPDFKKRGLPCKHMYYIAHNLGLQELPAPYWGEDE